MKRVLRHVSDAIEKEEWKKRQETLCVVDVHERRCEADPIYQLLLFPDNPLEMENHETVKFVDRLISGIKPMLEKKYGDAFKNDSIIQTMFQQLEAPYCNSDIKVFFLLFIIKWESEVCQVVRELYTDENPLFGSKALDQYNHILRLLDRWIKETQNFPYSQFNIVQLVKNFLDVTTLEYIMGPFQ